MPRGRNLAASWLGCGGVGHKVREDLRKGSLVHTDSAPQAFPVLVFVAKGQRPKSPRLQARAFRKLPSLAVALNWRIGSSSLEAGVKAFDRVHIVRG